MKKYLLLFILAVLTAFTVIDLKPVDADGSVTFAIKNLA